MKKNQARCNLCQDIITSTHRHDFVTCKCGAISVDGGNDYWKRSGYPENFDKAFEPEELENED